MDEIRPPEEETAESTPAQATDSFGVADVAVVAAFFGTAGLPILHVIGPLILLPFMAISTAKLIWPLLRWATARRSGNAAGSGDRRLIGAVDQSLACRKRWIAATIGLLTAAVLSIFPAFMAIFLFDDPKAPDDPLRTAIGYALMTLPLVFFCAAVFPWRFRMHQRAWWLFLMPLANGAVLALSLLPSFRMFG